MMCVSVIPYLPSGLAESNNIISNVCLIFLAL